MRLPIAILAGGLATRLNSITETIPKSLVDVCGRPFAELQVELLRRHGFEEILFLVGHLGEMVRDTLGDGSRWGLRIRYAFDGPALLGTGGAIRRALGELADPFLVLYGDSYLECDYQSVQQVFLESGKDALMTIHRNDDNWDRSNVWFQDNRIIAHDKTQRTPGMRHIDYGLGAFRKAAFATRGADEPFDLASVYQHLIATDNLAAFEVQGRFYEIGSPEGLEETRAYVAGKRST